jgi:hypothetical protein
MITVCFEEVKLLGFWRYFWQRGEGEAAHELGNFGATCVSSQTFHQNGLRLEFQM